MKPVQADETGTRHFRSVPAFHNLHNVESLIFCQLMHFCAQLALCLSVNIPKNDLCSFPCLSPDMISRSAHLGGSNHFTESACTPLSSSAPQLSPSYRYFMPSLLSLRILPASTHRPSRSQDRQRRIDSGFPSGYIRLVPYRIRWYTSYQHYYSPTVQKAEIWSLSLFREDAICHEWMFK